MSAKMWPGRKAAAREWEEAAVAEFPEEEPSGEAAGNLARLWRLKELYAGRQEGSGSANQALRPPGLHKKFRLPPDS
jgi:hypothetical protein